jgi:alpha-galactosidase
MSMNCWATEVMGVRTVGLCHSVQHTSEMLAREIGVPYEEVVYDVAGINHTAWFTTFRRGSEDLLPRIFDVMSAKHVEGGSAGDESDELHGGGSERVRSRKRVTISSQRSPFEESR